MAARRHEISLHVLEYFSASEDKFEQANYLLNDFVFFAMQKT